MNEIPLNYDGIHLKALYQRQRTHSFSAIVAYIQLPLIVL